MAYSPSGALSVSAMLRRSANQQPDAECTVDTATGRTRTYGQTYARASGLAGGLRAAGLSDGGRVALIMLNCDRYFESFFAVPIAGGVVVPINIRLAAPEIKEQLAEGGVEYVIVDDAFKGLADSISLPCIKSFVYAGEGTPPPSCKLSYEALVAAAPVADARRGGDDTFGLFFTGGTTGAPKGVMLTHSNIVVNALGHVAALQYDPSSRYIHSAPMFHLADGASTFGITMAGGTHIFLPKFDPMEMLAAIPKYNVNKAMMVPAMMAIMLQVDPPGSKAKHDASSLKHIIYGASPMPEALLAPCMSKFPQAQFVQGYGMTETAPAICMLPAECHVAGDPRIRSVGRPVPWGEVTIWDDKCDEVKRGVVGEIVTRGPHVMKGYYNLPEKTAETISKDGWMHTGDGGYMDEAGYVYIVDRIKDMIITGGENVYSAEVENAVSKFPGVAMCAVIGTPDPKYGELVTAVVVPQPGKTIDEAALVAHCRTLIGNYKVPRKVIVRAELPMSGAGKILKQEIRKEFMTDALGRSKL